MKKELKVVILTSFLTSILTVLGSYFLMYSQLSYEQNYWKERIKTEKGIELIDKQTALMIEVNERILSNAILVRDFKILLTKHISDLNLGFLDESKSQYVLNKYFELQKQIIRLCSKMQESEFYFGSKVDSLLISLSEALDKNYNNNLILSSTNLKSKDINLINKYFNQDFGTIKILTEKRFELIEAMRNEIGKNTTLIYEQELK